MKFPIVGVFETWLNNCHHFSKIAGYKLKDVRAQNVPTYRFFFKLATQKGNDILLSQRQKKGGHRARFRDHEVHFSKIALL